MALHLLFRLSMTRWIAHNSSNRPQSPFHLILAFALRRLICTILIAIALNNAFVLDLMHVLTRLQTLSVIGSMTGMTGVDTRWTQSGFQRFNHQRLDTVDLTRHVKKWDVSVRHLKLEPMGAGGYWFGQSYDGVH